MLKRIEMHGENPSSYSRKLVVILVVWLVSEKEGVSRDEITAELSAKLNEIDTNKAIKQAIESNLIRSVKLPSRGYRITCKGESVVSNFDLVLDCCDRVRNL